MDLAEEAVTAPVMYQFGPCEPEVIDVIKLADHERRLSNARFIREEHILSALSLSRVRAFVENMEIGPELRYQGGSSELYTYELYRLSSYLAKEKDGILILQITEKRMIYMLAEAAKWMIYMLCALGCPFL